MSDVDAAARALEEVLPGLVERDAPSAPLTTYRIGGPLAVLVRVGDDAEALAAARVLAELRPPVLVVGRGSNLLVADSGFAGVAVLLERGFDRLDLSPASSGEVGAGGAVALPVLARRSAALGCAGLEFYVGIPGSVGGAVRMNAGGHGRETRDVLVSARVLDLHAVEVAERTPAALALGYRRSALAGHEMVLGARFAVAPDAPEACEARVADIVRWRRENQPGGANAGSVFTNPPGDAAGRLIDACGCKGLRVGGAAVSTKHANFFQADPGTRAADVAGLVREVARRVERSTGVRLRPELRLVGFPDDARPDPAGEGATDDREVTR